MEWISVNDRLPTEDESKEYTLETMAGRIPIKCVLWMKVGFQEPHAAHWKVGHIGQTHWMPLSDHPTDKVKVPPSCTCGYDARNNERDADLDCPVHFPVAKEKASG